MRPLFMRPEHDVMESAIRPQDIAAIAEELGKSEDTIYRWRRRPNSVDDQHVTGRNSPLAECLRLIRAVYHTNPSGADEIVDKLRDELNRLRGRSRAPLTPGEIIAEAEATRSRLNDFIAALRQGKE